MADAHANFATSLVATAPSPATSGTSLVVTGGEGTRFPAAPFNATVCPVGSAPTPANAEIVRVTGVSTDTFTITRAQESSSARTVVVGDRIYAGPTAKTLTDAEFPRLPRFISGAWYGPMGLAEASGGGLTLDELRLIPFDVPRNVTFDRIGVNVSSAGTAGTVMRLGVYLDDGAAGPNALVLDAGTVVTDSTGRKEITISQALGPGVYWIGGASQVAGASRGNVTRLANTTIKSVNGWAMYQGANSNFTVQPSGFVRASVSGALPSTLTPVRADFESSSDMPYVWLRAA